MAYGARKQKKPQKSFYQIFKIYGGYFGHVQLKMLQASGRSGVVGEKELNQCPASISEKLRQGKTINVLKHGIALVSMFIKITVYIGL